MLTFCEFNDHDLGRFSGKSFDVVQTFIEFLVVLINGLLFFSEWFEFFNHPVIAFENFVSVVLHAVVNDVLDFG